MADPIINNIQANNTSSAYASNTKSENSTDLDKDAFLQLLVTQMRYQDPMNPGDATQYMSQLAQYSSLEATMNISSTLEKGNALSLVGQYVIMDTTDSAGNSKMVSGLVQYATVKDGETMLSIDDVYYPAEDLESVVDYDYYLYINGLTGDKVESPEGENDKVDDNQAGDKIPEEDKTSGDTVTE